MSTPLKERALYQKFVSNHTVYVAIKDNEIRGRLIIRFHQNSGDESVDWTDYTNHMNDANGKAYYSHEAMKGMKFDGNIFDGKTNPVYQMRAWGYNVVTVIC